MIAIIVAFFSSVLAALPQILTAATVVIIAAKALKVAFASFMIFVFPKILKKYFLSAALEKISAASGFLDDSVLGSATIQLTGLAAYLADQTGLNDCFPMFISAILTSFFLKIAVKN